MPNNSIVGRGFEVFDDVKRRVPSLNRDTRIGSISGGLPELPPGGDINVNLSRPTGAGGVIALPEDYEDKNIFTLNFDLSAVFTNTLIDIPGSVIWISGESGGTMAPISVRFDSQNNDPIDMPYDRAISGIPFRRVYISNAATQSGITAKITIIKDKPFDRVGMNG